MDFSIELLVSPQNLNWKDGNPFKQQGEGGEEEAAPDAYLQWLKFKFGCFPK